MNHGVFSFGDNAKESYDRMIDIANIAERYLKKKKVWKKYLKSHSKPSLIKLSKIRKLASKLAGSSIICKLNNSPEAIGFSNHPKSASLSLSGTLTPDHVIRTKPFAWIIGKNLEASIENFANKYKKYFENNKTTGLTMLDIGPKWALWPGNGIVCFGRSNTETNIIRDINNHTFRAMQISEALHKWKPLPISKLFEVEYWELEQAKLKKGNSSLPFQGQIAIVTGAASGIGKACTEIMLKRGCLVIGLDKNQNIVRLFHKNNNYQGYKCDLTKSRQVKKIIEEVILNFGGIDILVSNAGIFPNSTPLESISDKKWRKEIDINLTTHHYLLRECIPYLKNGIESSIVFIGTRNVGAPGPGAGTYTIAKSGLTQLARLAAIELAPYQIRVNIIHPDCVYDTSVWTKKILRDRAKQYGISVENYKSRNLLKKSVHSMDVAEVVSFLASKEAAKTTGAQVPVDGGNDRII